MIRSVIGLTSALIDDDSFSAAIFPRHFWMDVILPIAAAREGLFAILKGASSDISR
jgi:hypothetical protein